MKFIESSGDGGAKHFVKLKDNESIRGVFRGDPYDFKRHWLDNRSVICVGAAECPACKEGKKPAFRFRLNIVVKEGDEFVSKIFEQGWTVYSYLRNLQHPPHDEEGYDLEKTAINITRKGTGTETEYLLVPSKAVLTAEQEKLIAKVQLHDLKNPGGGESVTNSDEEVPF